jgi:hypothetical protein
MKKLIAALIILLGVLLTVNFSQADSSQLQSYYNDFITKKIANCERIASIDNHQNSCVVKLVKMRALQAEFYKKYKKQLIEAMVVNNVGTESYKVDYFLITQFKNRGQYALHK